MAPKKRRSTFLGPVGRDVEVTFSMHALGRFIERFTPCGPDRQGHIDADLFEQMEPTDQTAVFQRALDAGLPIDVYLEGVRNPNSGREDEVSHQSYGRSGDTKYCRWFRPVIGGRRVICQIVFVVVRPAADGFPGSIRIVTVYPPATR